MFLWCFGLAHPPSFPQCPCFCLYFPFTISFKNILHFIFLRRQRIRCSSRILCWREPCIVAMTIHGIFWWSWMTARMGSRGYLPGKTTLSSYYLQGFFQTSIFFLGNYYFARNTEHFPARSWKWLGQNVKILVFCFHGFYIRPDNVQLSHSLTPEMTTC